MNKYGVIQNKTFFISSGGNGYAEKIPTKLRRHTSQRVTYVLTTKNRTFMFFGVYLDKENAIL